MRPQALWDNDPIFMEIGVRDANLARSLRHEGYGKYLGVSGDEQLVARLQVQHVEVAGQLLHSKRRKLVLNNNAQVLALDGRAMLHLWKYRSVRHAEWVLWRYKLSFLSLLALLGCLCHLLVRRFSFPRVVTFQSPNGKQTRMLASRILRPKLCRRKALHFIPHHLGLTETFREFDAKNVDYVVLRWFEGLPSIEPDEDVDLLIADESMEHALEVLNSSPGVQPCDVYSETGLARSDYCGTPYYPAKVARRLLDGAVRHNNLCMVPNPWDYFHSLAYHAVYHKGPRSDLSPGETGVRPKGKQSHDYAAILQDMANKLGVQAEISLEGLHEYLQATGWGPSPEMLGRLAVACWRNKWLQLLVQRLERHVVDHGLTVFAVRKEAVEQGYQDLIVSRIRESGFDILATKKLSEQEIDFAAARTRGGNWTHGGPFERSGGPPAFAVIAYDRNPLPLNRKQRRRFPERTNARIFVKETIRKKIISQLPAGQSFNGLHSSDHAPEAWHLIEVLAPELLEETRGQLYRIYGDLPAQPSFRRAA